MGNVDICLTGEIIDITTPADEKTPVYPGDTPMTIRWLHDVEQFLSEITFTPHIATHVDFPKHFGFKLDTNWVDKLDTFVGVCDVIDFEQWRASVEDICNLPKDLSPRILFRFTNKSQGVPLELAPVLIQGGIKLVGTNNASVDNEDSLTFDFHKAVLSEGICLLENLDLTNVEPGKYFLNAAPLKWSKLEAVPTRAYLIKIKDEKEKDKDKDKK